MQKTRLGKSHTKIPTFKYWHIPTCIYESMYTIHTYGLAQFENLFKFTHGLVVVGKEEGRMFAHGYPMCKLECKQRL